MRYKGELFQKGIATLKRYGTDKYKLTVHKSLRQEGYEIEKLYKRKCTVNDEKLDCNIARSRSKIFEYGYCNDWQHFFTTTLDAKKYDRYDLDKFKKDLSQWLRNYGKKHKIKIDYLYIAEQHKDGAWHVHGLLNGLSEEHLSEFVEGVHPQKLIDAGYKNWLPLAKKFGWVTFDKIKNKEAICKYITKYVTKSMATRNEELGAHLYYVSKGLKTAELIKKGTMSGNIIPDYENDYVKVQWLTTLQDALDLFNDQIIQQVTQKEQPAPDAWLKNELQISMNSNLSAVNRYRGRTRVTVFR
jgi:hypothetical protein